MEELNTLSKVKKFISWCKKNQVKAFRYGEISFELSDLGLVQECYPESIMQKSDVDVEEQAQEDKESENLEEEQEKLEDDEMLFWSS